MAGEWFKLYEFNLKAILNDFSGSRSPLPPSQGFNLVKKANKEIDQLKKANKDLAFEIERLKDQMEEMYQAGLVEEASRRI